MDTKKPSALNELIQVVSQLRSRTKGCPWDLEQTHISLMPYLLEEAHETIDAIRHGTDKNLKEELGDLLFQILLHAQIAKEEERFDLEDIAKSASQKMIRRHPHVFGNDKIFNVEEVNQNWERIKLSEQSPTSTRTPLTDRLRKTVRSQSAIAGAIEISKKAAKAGFEWENFEGVWGKVNEELNELKYALEKKELSNAQEELGDVIFTLINVARWWSLSPEEGLASTNQRFLDRLSYIESAIEGNFDKQSLSNLETLWKAAKKHIKSKQSI